jgi:hypothetical protein
MATYTTKKQIGEHTYELQVFGSKEGQRVLLLLARFLGPALGTIAEKGMGSIGNALETFARTANPDDLEALTDAFTAKTVLLREATTTKGKQTVRINLSDIYDQHFARKYVDLFQWLAWCVTENYSDFLGSKAVAGLIKKPESEKEPPSESQTG